MDRDHVITTLRTHERELREARIVGVRLRGDAGEAPDVDLLAKFDKVKRLCLVDVVGLENRLSDLPGAKVDLVQEGKAIARIEEDTKGLSFEGESPVPPRN